MAMPSYSQNGEDRVLKAALRSVRRGFYIDVGAHHPTVHSVTKLFYERGWSGINIEPVAHWFDPLAAARPRDVNLRLAAGAEDGEVVLHELVDTGLSTVIAHHAERHEAAGFARRSYGVRARTLAGICAEHVKGPIHFLKIDAEGAEADILKGSDFARYRPRIVMIEATEPLTEIASYQESEDLLRAARYRFAAGDGLNRYYVAEEWPRLTGKLKRAVVREQLRRRNEKAKVLGVPLARRLRWRLKAALGVKPFPSL